MYAHNTAVIVPAEIWEYHGHDGPRANGIAQPERGVIIDTSGRRHQVRLDSDGCTVWADVDVLAPAEPEPAPLADWERELLGDTQPDADEPPSDPLEAWEASLSNPDTVRAAIWEAADAAADRHSACREYERTVAWPNGHTGRTDIDEDGDEDTYEAGYVEFTRVITRTVRVTQSARIWVDEGDDAYETADYHDDWSDEEEETYDEEHYDGPSMYDDERAHRPIRAEIGDPRPMADLLREAIGSDTSYHLIRDAILTTAQEHGAPVRKTMRVGLSARIVSGEDGAMSVGAYQARGVEVTARDHAYLFPETWNAYTSGDRANVVHRLLLTTLPDTVPSSGYILPGTIAVTQADTWEETQA